MASPRRSSNKAKIARRVIEVLEFFDDDHPNATVMDIVRRYNRPQSSTSELLSSLVELGVLYKDPRSRSYSPTARAAMIGSAGQCGMVRDGSLVRLTDRLVAQTGLPVALFGMVGLNVQIVSWRNGSRASPAAVRGLGGGLQQPLSDSAAGLLLLSTVEPTRREGMIRRLNAEAEEANKFPVAEVCRRVEEFGQAGTAQGPMGFDTRAEVLVRLVQLSGSEHPLAIGLVYGAHDQVNPDGLAASLDEAIRSCRNGDSVSASVNVLATAA